jgi:circadian clock protein KaiB
MSRYTLYLFVAGTTVRSVDAIQSVREMCEGQLKGRCDLKVVDIYKQPELARAEQIIAVPTLLKKYPVPVKKFIGDLSNIRHILSSFE